MYAIHIENLVKQYKNGVKALNKFNLTVNEGEIFSLLGENGAGKSSLINILTTYLSPTSGSVIMFEKNLSKERHYIRSQIASVAQHISIDTHLSLTENMMFQSRLYKVPTKKATERMKHLIDCFGLENYLKYSVKSYSGGIKRRLDIALNMMSNPKILFLDEPTVGMDVKSRMSMWDMIKKIRNDFGTTIFLTTHYLEEAEQLSDTICIMKEGQEIIQGSPKKLREYLNQDLLKISFETKENAKSSLKKLENIIALKSTDCRDNIIITNFENNYDNFANINKWLLEQKIYFTGIEIIKPCLEDVFLRLTEQN